MSNVNARLLHDGLSNPSLHAQLEADLVYPELLAGLHTVRSQRAPQQSVIFTRRSLLLLAKISLGLRDDRTAGDANEREIGTCILIIPRRFDSAHSSRSVAGSCCLTTTSRLNG
ncbi:MAG TPA: hypothetical protein VLC46_10890 [Thermoanaerobaculia bacterium]|nr:hypothetical protein [Thermoanaerobaculia bacterium]